MTKTSSKQRWGNPGSCETRAWRWHQVLSAMLLSAFCLGSAADAGAQLSRTEGWVFGLDFGGAAASFEDNPFDRGPLVGGRVGYGFTKIITLYAGVHEIDVDTKEFDKFDKLTFGHIDLAMRLHLANTGRRWVPYVDLLTTLWAVGDVTLNGERSTTDFNGRAGSSIGGGLAVHWSEAWALDLNFKWGVGLFKDIEIDNITTSESEQHVHTFLDIEAKTARFTVGVSWWPSRRGQSR